MDNFTFFNSTRILFGKGQIAQLSEQIPADARVLITYGGGSIKRNGILDQVKRALADFTLFEFGGIEPNPRFETAVRAAEVVRKEKIDFLLAVGGGSVIDGTKFIAGAARYKGDAWDIVNSQGAVVEDAVPLGCVLTLSGTGSEMNIGGAISRDDDKLSFFSEHFRPRFSVLDPEATYSLPPKQIGNGVVDAFSHVAEQYVTYPVDARVHDRFAEGLMQTLIEEGPKALVTPQDYDVRANIMWSATLALNGLIRGGVPQDWASHMIGLPLTSLYGIDHGATLAIVMPALWQHQRQRKQAKLIQYGQRVLNVQETDPEMIVDVTIQRTREFFESMGVATHLSDYGLGEEIIPKVTAKLHEYGQTTLGEHADIGPDEAAQILRLAL